jgi:hypothetical protein
MSFIVYSGTTKAEIPSPRDWDLSVERPMQVTRTLSSAVVSSWVKTTAGRQPRYVQRMTEAEYVALAALDDAVTSVTLVADGHVYTAVMDIKSASRVYQNGSPHREVEIVFTIVSEET